MTQELQDYHHVILSEFHYRKVVNGSYSLRAFARDLGLSPSRLSEILTRKGELSPEKAGPIAVKLGLKNSDVEIFKSLVVLRSKKTSPKEKAMAQEVLDQSKHSSSFKIIDEATFCLIARPEHLEILVAMDLDAYDGTIDFLKNHLSIEEGELIACLDRLKNEKLIFQKEDKLYPLGEYLATTHDTPSKALRLSHKLTLDKAIKSLDEIRVELRDITSITMAIDIDKLPEAKQEIKEFRRKLSKLLNENEKKTHVYNLNIQLYPVSKVPP